MPTIGDAISRRAVLKAAGASAVAGAGAGAVINTGRATSSDWSEQSTPIEKSLYDVVYTTDGPYAVGNGGYVLGRNGGSWEIEVSNGPNNSGNPLHSVDVTDDGKRIYFAGGSGALGAYDVEEGIKYDYTAPDGKTSTWEGIAVSGDVEQEQLIVANGSGETMDAQRQEDEDGNMCLVWGDVTEPAGGSTIPELDFAGDDPNRCRGISTSQQVFESTDLNDTWADIGVDDAQETFYDITGSTDVVYVAAGSGTIYRRDCDCGVWTPIDAGSNALLGIDRFYDGSEEEIMASAGGGYVYERTSDGWVEMETPVTADLYGVALPTADFLSSIPEKVDVAVGSSGKVVERA
ncbi:WD40/YVTN/BNR-like repeat-containing protein [Haloparvum sp. PAK95]|uniref:WD40/YVTN/BNR-like repeat-containing protein n=1 Tax=Haloparvum sp. PAK95 TaxID=3418962 RepID=UPI003D2F0102